MSYRWTFRSRHGQRWELVVEKDVAIPGDRATRAPGYESDKLRDILEACWYLNGCTYTGKLSERNKRILDQIRADMLDLLGGE